MSINRFGIPSTEENEFFCSEPCFQKADRFLRRSASYSLPSILFLGFILLVVFNSFWLARNLYISHNYILFVAMFSVGILLEFFPFTTPETIQYFGLKRGILFTRAIGLLLILLAFAILGLA